MFGRKRPKPAEDPSVARVEAVLDGAATHLAAPAPSGESRPSATHALWICACVTLGDAPTWLIYADLHGGIVWCRIPDGTEASDIVDAEFMAGGHADPGEVLAWLQAKAPDPWAAGGHGWGDDEALSELRRRIRAS